MAKFRFEISNCINVEVEADNKEEARSEVIYRLEKGDYNHDMCSPSSFVSDGKEVEGDEDTG